MRIAVTGATGFIGRHIANRLAVTGHTVLAYGRRETPSGLLPSIEYRRWDISEQLQGPRVHAVVHSAAYVSDWGLYSDLHATNVVGTQNVLNAFKSSEQFVHISTASVYSRPNPCGGLKESDALIGQPQDNYGITKALAEDAVLQSDRPAIILRPRAVYGEGDTSLLPRLIKASKFGHLLAIGGGNNEVSITHVNNLVHAVERSLETKSEAAVYNIADGETVKISHLLSVIANTVGLSRNVWFIPHRIVMPLAVINEVIHTVFRLSSQPSITRYAVNQLSKSWTLDISRACQLLDYAPESTYRDALAGIRAEYNADRVD
jgi:2-alkyl-3-oxoalkanoate reductase